MDSRITYYLGAGASYNALPVLDELSSTMNQFNIGTTEHNDWNTFNEDLINPIPDDEFPFKTNSLSYWKLEFRRLGRASSKFNTIDTYAKKLFIQEDNEKLNHLKHVFNVFLTIWQLSLSKTIYHSTKNQSPKNIVTSIDYRYISLIASFIIKKNRGSIPENINFISWNYDLQLEMAFSKFLDEHGLMSVNKRFRFHSDQTKFQNQIFHLNGFSGFYMDNTNTIKPIVDLDQIDGKSNKDIIKLVLERTENHTLKNAINYAWEDNPYADKIRKGALEIASKTEILVIIGYSFPIFNRKTDKLFFKTMIESRNLKQIIYQDPNADEDFLRNAFNIPTENITFGIEIIIEKNVSQFSIPNI